MPQPKTKRSFANISKQTEELRKERLGHITTEKTSEISNEQPKPTENEKIIDEVKEIVKEQMANKTEEAIPVKQEPVKAQESTEVVRVQRVEKPKERVEKRKEKSAEEEKVFVDSIKIQAFWNQVIQIIHKQNKGKYNNRETVLDIIIERGIKGLDNSEEIMEFVEKMNKMRG